MRTKENSNDPFYPLLLNVPLFITCKRILFVVGKNDRADRPHFDGQVRKIMEW